MFLFIYKRRRKRDRKSNCRFYSIWQWEIFHDFSVLFAECLCLFLAFNAYHFVDFRFCTEVRFVIEHSCLLFTFIFQYANSSFSLWIYTPSSPQSKSAIKLMYKFFFPAQILYPLLLLCFAFPLQKQFDPIVSFFDLLLNWLMCTLFKWSRHLFHFSQFIGRSFFAVDLSLSLPLHQYRVVLFPLSLDIVQCVCIHFQFSSEGKFKVSCSLYLPCSPSLLLSPSSSQWNYIINFVNWQMDYYLKKIRLITWTYSQVDEWNSTTA